MSSHCEGVIEFIANRPAIHRVADQHQRVVQLADIIGVPGPGPARDVEHRRDHLASESPYQHLVQQKRRSGPAAAEVAAVHHQPVGRVDEGAHRNPRHDRRFGLVDDATPAPDPASRPAPGRRGTATAR